MNRTAVTLNLSYVYVSLLSLLWNNLICLKGSNYEVYVLP